MELIKLSNGIKAIVEPLPGIEIVAGSFFFPLGSSLDPEGKEGITLLTLKTGLKRSSLQPSQAFYGKLEELGTSFVPEVSSDYSVLRFQSLSREFGNYGKLLIETLLNPSFDEKEFTIEKNNLLAAIRAKQESPFTLAYEKLMETTYEGTPYSKMPYGREESVREIELQECKNWYGNFIPEDSVLSLCGEVKEIESFLSSIEKLPTKKVKKLKFESEVKEERSETVIRKGSVQSFIAVCFGAPSVSSENYLKYKLVNTVLGEGIGSILFQELREKEGLAYSTGSIFPTRFNSGRIILYVGTSPEKESRAREKLRQILKNLPNFITENRVNRAKEYFKGSYLLDRETRSRRAWYLGFWEISERGYKFDRRILEEIDKISTSSLAETAAEIARKSIHEVVVKDEENHS